MSPNSARNHILSIWLFTSLACLVAIEMPGGGFFLPVGRDIDHSIKCYAIL